MELKSIQCIYGTQKLGGEIKLSPRTGRPTDALKNHDLKVRVDDKLYDRLLRYADDNNITKAEAIRRVLDEHLPKN